MAQWLAHLEFEPQGPGFDSNSRIVPLFHWVATMGKLFAHIASPVSQLQETGVQKGVFRAVIHSYSFINVAYQNARTCIIYSNVNELYELKKFTGLCTLRIVNMLVELNHKTRQRIKSYM